MIAEGTSITEMADIAEGMMTIEETAVFLDHVAEGFLSRMSEKDRKVAENLWQRLLPALEACEGGPHIEMAVLSRLAAQAFGAAVSTYAKTLN